MTVLKDLGNGYSDIVRENEINDTFSINDNNKIIEMIVNSKIVRDSGMAFTDYLLFVIFQLWKLIDDIDTIGDIAKSDDKLYRRFVEEKQRGRFKFVDSEVVDAIYDKYYEHPDNFANYIFSTLGSTSMDDRDDMVGGLSQVFDRFKDKITHHEK